MKRFLKWFFGILILLIVLVIGAAISLPYIVDPNQHKPEIIAQLKPYMLGRDLKIPGKITLSIIPWLGVDIGDTVVGNADGFVVKPFMTVKHLRAHVRLLSLLTGKPEIGSVELEGIVVNLQRDAEGRNNWSDLSAHSGPAPAKAQKMSMTTSPAAIALLPKLKIEGVHIKDATINFDDRQNKNDVLINKLNLDAGPIEQLNPIPLKGQFNYYSKTQGLVAASAFATTAAIDPLSKSVSLQQFVINTNLAGEALNNKTMATSLKVPSLNIDIGKETIEAKPFQLSLNKMQSEGRLHLRRFSNPIIQLNLDMQELDLDSLLPHSKPVAPVATKASDEESADTSPAIFAALLPLKTADIQGTLRFKKLIFNKLPFENVTLNLLARGGLISALPQAKLFTGNYEGDIQIDVRKPIVNVRSKQKIQNLPMGPVMLALTGKESMTGNANVDGQFLSQGDTLDSVTSQLNGDITFNMRDVQLTLVDVEQLILQKWYDKVQLAAKTDPNKKVTAFDFMRGTIRVQNGIAYNHDFTAVSQRVHLTGSGQANLVKQTVDYTLVTIPKKSLEIVLGTVRYDLKDKRLPTYIRGPWSHIEMNYDLGGLMKDDLNNKVDTEKQKQQEKLQNKLDTEKQKLENKVKDKLQNLLNR